MLPEVSGRQRLSASRPLWSPAGEATLGLAAVAVTIATLIAGFRPVWPLLAAALALAAGLLGPAQALRHGERWRGEARALAAIGPLGALLVLGLWLPRPHTKWHLSPLLIIALLACLALAADALIVRSRGGSRRESLWALAAAAALTLLVAKFAVEHFYFIDHGYRNGHRIPMHRFIVWEQLPLPQLHVVMVILAVGLLATRLTPLTAAARYVLPSALVVATFVLLLSLPTHVAPNWPIFALSGILVLGLIADPLSRLLGDPEARRLLQRVDELARTRRGALDVQASELRRIERDLHDGAQVRLVALALKLGRAEDSYRDDPHTVALLREAREDAQAAIRELRELARGIAPPVLTDRGLEAAVQSLAQRSGAEVTVSASVANRPTPATELAAYFVVAEALTNAAKHAPGARVEVHLAERAGDLFVEIVDFGPGGADPQGSGLTGLRQRVEALDGTFHITSRAGVGTQIEAVLPCGR